MNKLIELSMQPSENNLTTNTVPSQVGTANGLQFDQMTVASLEGWPKKTADGKR
jgi:hypothetical protein